MPSEFTAQNGALIAQSTPMAITGCAKPLSRAQQLAKALRSCRSKHNKAKRRSCEAQARRKYAQKPKKKRSSAKAGQTPAGHLETIAPKA